MKTKVIRTFLSGQKTPVNHVPPKLIRRHGIHDSTTRTVNYLKTPDSSLEVGPCRNFIVPSVPYHKSQNDIKNLKDKKNRNQYVPLLTLTHTKITDKRTRTAYVYRLPKSVIPDHYNTLLIIINGAVL